MNGSPERNARSRLTGRATPEATAARAPGQARLGATGLSVSRLGFGTYRVDDHTPSQADALARALRSGCNLIDTSTNYTDGGSERCVGAVLHALASEGALGRHEIVVVSKLGYVQGTNLRMAVERERQGRPFADMVHYMDGCWHCIHPEFLEDQLERSLERLGLETLDVCLLHNPEYFLSDAAQRGLGPLPALRDEFYRRLHDAFEYLESQVEAGRIGSYGVSSNTCVLPAEDGEATSLTRMMEAARAAGGNEHRFRVLQLPLNLIESGGVLETNNAGKTVLTLAAEKGLGVLVNRPLNAIHGHGIVRLAELRDGSNRGAVWQLTELLDPALPEESRDEPLSRKALWVLASTPGVSCVLLGMRRPEYVDDAMPVTEWPLLEDVGPAFRAFL